MLEHSFCAGCGESHRGSGEGGPWWRERTRGRRHVNVLWRGGNRVEWGDAGVLYPARILPASYDLRNILNQGTLRPVLPVGGHPQPIVSERNSFSRRSMARKRARAHAKGVCSPLGAPWDAARRGKDQQSLTRTVRTPDHMLHYCCIDSPNGSYVKKIRLKGPRMYKWT